MPRAIWTGAISFGLVSVPVELYSAIDQKDIAFDQFEEKSGKRIHNKRVAGNSNREVDFDNIVKGYEVRKGEFVIVTPEELEAVEPTRTRTIEIVDFVDLEEIDPIYFEKTYYLAPAADAGAEKPYALLQKVMQDRNKVAIGRFVMRTKEYLAAIRPYDGALALETLYFADEVRDLSDIDELPVRTRVTERERQIAQELVDRLTSDWDPQRYHDEYRERVLKLIRDKAKGKEIVAPEKPETPKVASLLEALRASIESTRTAGAKGGKGRSAPAKGRRRAAAMDLTGLSEKELLARAGKQDIDGRSKMSKDELVEALRKAS